MICVYSRPAPRDIPVSAAQVYLLDHQSRRLSAAVQKMASVITKYETGVEEPPSSFDVVEQLQRYVPDHTVEEQQTPSSDVSSSRLSKRKRSDGSAPAASCFPGTGDSAFTSGLDIPFEIQPNHGYDANPADSQEAYEAMLRFIRSMNYGQNAAIDAESMPSNPANSTGHDIPRTAPVAALSQEAPPFDFMSFVDWDASLQNLQDSQHLLFGSHNPSTGADEYFEQLVPGDSLLSSAEKPEG